MSMELLENNPNNTVCYSIIRKPQGVFANKLVNAFQGNFCPNGNNSSTDAASTAVRSAAVTKSKKRSIAAQSDIAQSGTNGAYLRAEVIQKMICRFLTEKKMPKQSLAEALEITVKSLNQLCSKKASQALILKVNLPLVKLYCKTRFW